MIPHNRHWHDWSAGVDGDPACATACPTGAITYVDADWTGFDKMRAWAGKTDNATRASA